MVTVVTDSQDQIQKAIDFVASVGGGKIILPPTPIAVENTFIPQSVTLIGQSR